MLLRTGDPVEIIVSAKSLNDIVNTPITSSPSVAIGYEAAAGMRSSIEFLRDGFIDCQAASDYSDAVCGALEISRLTFECGAHLDEFTSSFLTYAAFAEQSRKVGSPIST